MRWTAAVLILLFVLPGSALATPYNNLLARDRTEPAIAIDPANPSHIVVGVNPNYDAPVAGNFPVAYFTSRNGGRTFSGGSVPLVSPYAEAADPSLAIAGSGTVFYSFLGETAAFCSVGHSAILLSASYDGGRSFRTPVVVDVNRADDKPFMAVETPNSGPAHIFISWTRFIGSSSEIWYSRSADGGRTFSPAARLFASKGFNFGSLPVVGPGGRVYVFWASFPDRPMTSTSPARILLRAASNDGGRFGAVRSAAGTFWTIPKMMEPGSLRSLTAPTAAAGGDGTLYLAWAVATRDRGGGTVDVDILLSRSRDGGRTWTKGRAVNDVGRGDRFMPALSVLPAGDVGVAFYDRRSGATNLDVYAVRASFSGGFRRTANVRVTRGSAPIGDITYIKPGSTCLAAGRFFGDYIASVASPDNSLCVSWADTQSHVPGQTDIWFARVYLPGLPARGQSRWVGRQASG